MSYVIAFDLSLNSSGVCVIDYEKGTPVHYESVTSNLVGIERLNYNYNRFMNIFSTYRDVELVAFEEQNPQMRYSYSAGSILPLAENAGVWKLSLYQCLSLFTKGILVLGIPAQDIKKYATDNGKATKEDMIAAVNGNHIKSIRREIPEHSVNDVADAYHLAKMARDLVSNDKDYSKYVVGDYKFSPSQRESEPTT